MKLPEIPPGFVVLPQLMLGEIVPAIVALDHVRGVLPIQVQRPSPVAVRNGTQAERAMIQEVARDLCMVYVHGIPDGVVCHAPWEVVVSYFAGCGLELRGPDGVCSKEDGLRTLFEWAQQRAERGA